MKAINSQVPGSYQDRYKEGSYNFPPEDVPTSEKSKLWWCKLFAQAIWSQYCKGLTGTPYVAAGTNKYDYATLRLYAEGNQPVDQYRDAITHESHQAEPDKGDRNRFMYENISFANQSIIPKYRRAVINNLMGLESELTPLGVDETSMNERLRMKHFIWEKSKNEFYNKVRAALKLPEEEPLPFVPADKNELEMYAMTSLELGHEQKIKKVIDRIFEESMWNENIKRQLLQDAFDLDIVITNKVVDKNGNHVVVYEDPEYCIFPGSKSHIYDDMHYFARIRRTTIKELRAKVMAAGQYENEKTFMESLNGYMSAYNGLSGNRIFSHEPDPHGIYPYDDNSVTYLESEYQTYNTDVWITKKNRAGGTIEEMRSDPKYNRNDDRVTTRKNIYDMWYKCSWVIGTNFYWDYGPKEFTKRDNTGKTKCGATIYRIGSNSFVNQMIPIEDEQELITHRFQLAWRNAHPQGFAVFWSALQGLTYGSEKIHPLEALQLLMDKGVMILNDINLGDNVKDAQKAVAPLEGGVGPILNEYVVSWNACQAKMETIIGISGVLAGDSPNPGQLVKTTEISQMQSLKSISTLYDAYKFVKRTTYQKAIYDVMAQAKYDPKGFKMLFTEFSRNTVESILLLAEDGKYKYELKVEDEATPEMRQQMILAAQSASEKGQISYPDMLLISEYVHRGKVRFARMLMDYRISMNMKMQRQMNMEQIQANADSQNQSLQAKAQADAMLKELQGRIDQTLEVLKGKIEEHLMRVEDQLASNKADKGETGEKKPEDKNKDKKAGVNK